MKPMAFKLNIAQSLLLYMLYPLLYFRENNARYFSLDNALFLLKI